MTRCLEFGFGHIIRISNSAKQPVYAFHVLPVGMGATSALGAASSRSNCREIKSPQFEINYQLHSW